MPAKRMAADRTYTSRCLEHLRFLAESIGPRGSATPAEAEAAGYAVRTLSALGLDPQVQAFSSAISAWRPYALAIILALLGLAIYPLAGQATAATAAALVLAVLVSTYLEINFRGNPLRWLLPKGRSHNVWAVLPPRGPVRQQAVLVGHLDTHRTPFVFKSASHLKIFGLLSPLGFGGMGGLLALFIAAAITEADIIKPIAVGIGVLLGAILILLVQADFTPYTPGANDNASGAAMVLALAERLRDQPLEHTQVWALNTGCEEVGCYGADAFLRANREALQGACFITIDTVGGPGTGPCYITREGMTRRYHSDRGLVALAERLAAERPELAAYAKTMALGYTEGAIGIKHGLRSLTFVNLRPDGVLPFWHQPADQVEQIDPDVLARTEAFIWELLKRIDEPTPSG